MEGRENQQKSIFHLSAAIPSALDTAGSLVVAKADQTPTMPTQSDSKRLKVILSDQSRFPESMQIHRHEWFAE